MDSGQRKQQQQTKANGVCQGVQMVARWSFEVTHIYNMYCIIYKLQRNLVQKVVLIKGRGDEMVDGHRT